MTTNTVQLSSKDQERKALEKIRKIVDELGPDSYVGTAFEGCFEIAEANIEFDFAGSMKSRWENEMVKSSALLETVEKLKDELSESQKDKDAELAKYKGEVAELEKEASAKETETQRLKGRIQELLSEQQLATATLSDLLNKKQELKERAEKAEAEVIHLKAKLYDYIVAGA